MSFPIPGYFWNLPGQFGKIPHELNSESEFFSRLYLLRKNGILISDIRNISKYVKEKWFWERSRYAVTWYDIETKYSLLNVIKGIRRVTNSVSKNKTILNSVSKPRKNLISKLEFSGIIQSLQRIW